MSAAARPPRQARSRVAGHNQDGLPPSSSDDVPLGTRRSKRLGHVEIEDIRDFEALRTRKRSRSQKHDEEDARHNDEGEGQHDEENDQDVGEDAATPSVLEAPAAPEAADRLNRRQARTNLRIGPVRKAAKGINRSESRRAEEAQASQAYHHTIRETRPTRTTRGLHEPRPSRSDAPTREDDAVHETEPGEDIYELQASSPARLEPEKQTSDTYQNGKASTPWGFETGDGLFVEQEVDNVDEDDGGERLYDDPTIMVLPHSAQPGEEDRPTEDAVSEKDPQSNAEAEQIRRLVVDMGPAPIEPSDGAGDAYPDDHFIFNAPTGQDRVAAAPVKSYSLKSITELMGGVGWTQSRGEITLETKKEQLSKRTRSLWNEVCELKHFWGGMPRAPLFDQQCDYLHSSDEDASDARLKIKEVDELVRAVAEKAKKRSHGEESDMPPSRFVVELYERIIPLLVNTLENVFRKGADLERSRYTGRFTKTTLQIMQRVVAWIERLYDAMQAHLARRRLKEQPPSKRISRGKLAEYLRGFNSELKQTWRRTDEVMERQRLYEERLLFLRARKEQEQREFEEARRRQRELCDRRLEEHLRRVAIERAQGEAPPFSQRSSARRASSQRANRGTQPAAPTQDQTEEGEEMTSVGPSRPWPEEDVKKLLRILTARPRTEMEALVWEFERSEEDVRAMVNLLKQSARTYAASKGKGIPAFAAL